MHSKFSYDEHARNCDPNDLLGQSKRTIKGEPVSDTQLTLIVDAIKQGLDIRDQDVVLDIACGNGSLSHFIFPFCQSYLGIDISEYLIQVAKRKFEQPKFEFTHGSGLELIQQAETPERYTKLLCYAAIQYFTDNELSKMLTTVNLRFTNIGRMFIGNIPDRELANTFYKTHTPTAAELDDTQTAIGRWRTRDQVSAIAEQAGWRVQFSKMPGEFYASTYRFDATLTHVK